MNSIKTGLIAVLGPAVLGTVCAYLSVRHFHVYGLVIFVGVPFAVSFCSSLLFRRGFRVRWLTTYLIAMLSILAMGALILLIALDGMLCLLMALPLAWIIAIPGSMAGHVFGSSIETAKSVPVGIGLFGILPLLMGLERNTPAGISVHMVVSSVAVESPISQVWDEVIAFDRITTPPSGIFRMGIAYPIEAKIEGQGVGAIRHCIFSTGAFVEPVTEWSKPHTLAFDVIENPLPMKEFSIYADLDVPHLHDTFTAVRGQFKLRQESNVTILEGTTWYTQKLFPDWYWHPISDEIIHLIHLRVLNHIKKVAETPS